VVQETVLAWTLSGRIPAVTAQSNTQRTFLLREGSNLEHDLNRFLEETMMQPITTTEQAREEHFSFTQPNNQMGDLLSSQNGTQSTSDFSSHSTAMTTCKSMQAGQRS